jgi:hypothetical protein
MARLTTEYTELLRPIYLGPRLSKFGVAFPEAGLRLSWESSDVRRRLGALGSLTEFLYHVDVPFISFVHVSVGIREPPM